MARGEDCCENMKKAMERCLKNLPDEDRLSARQALDALKAIKESA